MKRSLIRVTIAIFLIQIGCSSRPVVTQTGETYPAEEGNGGPVSISTDTPAESFGPDVPSKKNGIVLVLGPGLARAIASVGVLKAFREAQIPINAILGVEMGALVGALYFKSKSLNRLDWMLMKINRDDFIDSRLKNLLRKPHDGARLRSDLTKIFGEMAFEDLVAPLFVGAEEAQPEESAHLRVTKSGSIVKGLMETLSIPGLFLESAEEHLRSPVFTAPYLIDEAKSLGLGPVVAVDVLAEKISQDRTDEDPRLVEYSDSLFQTRSKSREVLLRSDFVLRPELGNMAYGDFNKKNVAIFAGQKSVQKNKEALLDLID